MIFLIYPHQLFSNTQPLVGHKVLLIEEPLYFTQYKFHIQKLVMHRASMKFYEQYLHGKGFDVSYYEDESYLALFKDEKVSVYELGDIYLEKKVQKNFSQLQFVKNPNFIDLPEHSKRMQNFYIHRRKALQILVDEHQNPLGGVWSFDAQNRKKLPKNCVIPAPIVFENSYVQEAKEYCKRFETLGCCEEFLYPTTFQEAEIVLEYFLEHKFRDFGDYQDAITKENNPFLFHANISSALNIGLIDLSYLLQKVIDAPQIPMNSKEGFLRQIIGWREFMLSIYKHESAALRKQNFFHAHNPLTSKILEGKTGLVVLDEVIKKVSVTGYAHHIERLMVLGNIFVLLEIEPEAIFEYFMAHFIDAYDWVMVGNVYAMVCFGSTMTTKPYIAASNYILKMSDYKKGEWCGVLDALYWSFLEKHKEKLSSNIRMAMQLALLEKMDADKRANYLKEAKKFKEELGFYAFSEQSKDRLIEMAWQDRTPFEAIKEQFGYSENQVKKMMRKLISKSSFKMWRQRVQGRKTKHQQKAEVKPRRFQGPW